MMKQSALIIALALILTAVLPLACGEKDTGPSEDLSYKDFIGRWTGIKKSEENGVKITETLILIFWKQDEYLWYRWSHSVANDGIEDTSQYYEEQGQFEAANNEITFMPEDGEARTLPYSLLNSDPLYDLSITEEDGMEWKFEYFHRD
ncbi:hypothetical protein ACFLT7_03720 [candidate division KSB1 bacterium]